MSTPMIISFRSFSCPEISKAKKFGILILLTPTQKNAHICGSPQHKRPKGRLQTNCPCTRYVRAFVDGFHSRRWENRRECLFPEALCYQSTNICQYLFVVNWSKAIDFQHGFNHSSKPRKHEKMLIWVEKVRTKIKNPHYGMQNNLLGIL